MICSAVCLVRFMVKSPAQSGRLRTLIHPGPVSGVHVSAAPRVRRDVQEPPISTPVGTGITVVARPSSGLPISFWIEHILYRVNLLFQLPVIGHGLVPRDVRLAG